MSAHTSQSQARQHATMLGIPSLPRKVSQIGWIVYGLTLMLEAPGALLRYYFVIGSASLLSQFILFLQRLVQEIQGSVGQPLSVIGAGVSILSNNVWWFALGISLYPLVASVLSLVLPGGLFFHRFGLGARLPSQRELDSINQTIGVLTSSEQNKKVRLARDLYIIDNPEMEANVIGTTLYLSSGLVKDGFLTPLFAQALGHLNSFDGRLTLALRRLVFGPVYFFSQLLKLKAPGLLKVFGAVDSAAGCLASIFFFLVVFLLGIAGGGVGVLLLSPLWSWYWREREFAADAYAAQLGQRHNLIEYLDAYQGFDIAVPYLITDVPSSETRIDRLMYPDAYERAGTIELRPYLIGAIGFLLVACVVPTLISGIRNFSTSIVGDWQVTSLARSGGVDPFSPVSDNEQTYISFFGDNRFMAQTFYGSGSAQQAGGEASGTYRQIDANTIVVTTDETRGRLGFGGLNGTWKVEHRAGHVILRGDSASFELVPLGQVAATTGEQPGATSQAQNLAEPLYGRWQQIGLDRNGFVVEFNRNNTFTWGPQPPGRFTVPSEGRLILQFDTTSSEFMYTIQGDQLTLSPTSEGPTNTFVRQ